MIYSIILCGGVGKRMANSNIPKQFIEIEGKPIVIHTIEKFMMNINVDKIVISCHKEWINYLKSCLKKFGYVDKENIFIVEGGKSRNESIKNGLEYIKKNLNPNDEDVIITHDSVRMFVSERIINENVEQSKNEDVITDTCVKSVDTIVISKDLNVIDEIPDRNFYHNGQTPQSGKFWLMNKIYFKNSYDKKLFDSTDLCKLAEINKMKIVYVEGDYYNFKITTDFDLNLARMILKNNE